MLVNLMRFLCVDAAVVACKELLLHLTLVCHCGDLHNVAILSQSKFSRHEMNSGSVTLSFGIGKQLMCLSRPS